MLLLDSLNGNSVVVGEARFLAPRITVRQLIRARVELHFEHFNEQFESVRQKILARSNLAVASNSEAQSGDEQQLFGPGLLFSTSPQKCDTAQIEALVMLAQEGFAQNRFFLLLDDR